MNFAEKSIQTIGRRFGLEIRWHTVYSSEALNLQRLLAYHKIETVLDIGANIGEYALGLRKNGFTGRIISFEPLTDAYEKLQKNSLKVGKWVVAERMALGNSDGTIEINVSGNSQSSSLLPMLDAHIHSAPTSAYIKKETTLIKRLDSIGSKFDISGNLFIKIDVQGFEMDVLKGAVNTVAGATGLQVELSLVPLYEGQTMMMDMIHYLMGLGFDLHALFPVFKDEKSGRLLQADGIFFKR